MATAVTISIKSRNVNVLVRAMCYDTTSQSVRVRFRVLLYHLLAIAHLCTHTNTHTYIFIDVCIDISGLERVIKKCFRHKQVKCVILKSRIRTFTPGGKVPSLTILAAVDLIQ